MPRILAPLVLLIAAVPGLAQSPDGATIAALAHARMLPTGTRENTRYLSLYNLPKEDRIDWFKALSFWVNCLSRELDIVKPRFVSPDLVAVNLLDYGWSRITWEQLGLVDPYFHVQIIGDRVFFPGGPDADGKIYKAGWFQNQRKEKVPAVAPWINQLAAAELISLTQTGTPIVRLDWFIAQTAIQDGKKPGYYDFLGLGNKLKDFEDLAGLDRKLASRLRKETAAIVSTSIVALHNRQLFRFATLSGSWWESRDVKNNVGTKNALRFLNGDYGPPDAMELIFSLPNGLHGFGLVDGKGNRQNTAPDDIASDRTSGSPDRRVHVGLSCVRCHFPGINPIDDWSRKAYAAPDVLQVVGEEKFRRLRQLYLSELDKWIKRDQQDYTEAVKATNELSAIDNARLFAWAWSQYIDQPVTLDIAAKELGTTSDKMVAAFKASGTFPKTIDPVLFGLGKGMPTRREHWEELFGSAMEITRR